MEKRCGKVYYPTIDIAKEYAKKTNWVNKKRKKRVSKVSEYKCDKCDGYHLTSKDKKYYVKMGISNEELIRIKVVNEIRKVDEIKKRYGLL